MKIYYVRTEKTKMSLEPVRIPGMAKEDRLILNVFALGCEVDIVLWSTGEISPLNTEFKRGLGDDEELKLLILWSKRGSYCIVKTVEGVRGCFCHSENCPILK